MKHPTASADLAGKTWRPIERDPDQLFVFETFDGDALAGNVRAVGNMAREMARLVRPDDAIVPTFSRDELSTFSRKLWTEPTVTECATTNRRPATLTIAGGVDIVPRSLSGMPWGEDKDALQNRINEILTPRTSAEEIQALMDAIAIDWDYQVEFEYLGLAPVVTLTHHRPMIPLNPADAATIAGVDLPNPQPIDALLRDLTQEANWLGGDDAWGNTDWSAGPKGFDGTVYATDIRAAIAEIQRQAAEIAELQGMLEEAIGPVRLVSELATMTDTECDFMDAGDLRLRARGQLDGDFTMPRMYDGEDRKRAVEAILADRPKTNPLLAMEVVDIVATALGLRRA